MQNRYLSRLSGFAILLAAASAPLAVTAADKGADADGAGTAPGSAKTTLAPPACDGVTDDTATLQDWLDDAHTTGATFVVPATAAGCKITAPLEVRSGTHIVQHGRVFAGSGYAKPGPSSGQWGMYSILDNAANVVIEGAGTLDGNYQTQAAGIVAGGPEVGDAAANVRNLTVFGLTIKKMPALPAVRIDGSDGVRLEALNISDSASGVEVGYGTSKAVAVNLRIDDIAGNCFTLLNGASNSSLADSIISNCDAIGIGVFNLAASSAVNRDIVIDNNIVYGAQIGIKTYAQATAPSATGVVASANQTHHNREYGIGLTSCDGCQANANLTHHNGSAAVAYQSGILIANSRGVKVSANTVRNEGQGTATGRGIVVLDVDPLRPLSERVFLSANFIYDDQATRTIQAAFGGDVANAVVITGNAVGPGIGGMTTLLCDSPSICTNNNVLP